MVVTTTRNGKKVFRIRYEKTGKIGPKVYSSKGAAEKRIGQLESYKRK